MKYTHAIFILLLCGCARENAIDIDATTKLTSGDLITLKCDAWIKTSIVDANNKCVIVPDMEMQSSYYGSGGEIFVKTGQEYRISKILKVSGLNWFYGYVDFNYIYVTADVYGENKECNINDLLWGIDKNCNQNSCVLLGRRLTNH